MGSSHYFLCVLLHMPYLFGAHSLGIPSLGGLFGYTPRYLIQDLTFSKESFHPLLLVAVQSLVSIGIKCFCQDQIIEVGYLITRRVYMLSHFIVIDSSGTLEFPDSSLIGESPGICYSMAS